MSSSSFSLSIALNGLISLPVDSKVDCGTARVVSIPKFAALAPYTRMFRQVSFEEITLRATRPKTGCGILFAAFIPQGLFADSPLGLDGDDFAGLEGMDSTFIDAGATTGATVDLHPRLPAGCVRHLKGEFEVDSKVDLFLAWVSTTATTGTVQITWRGNFDCQGRAYVYTGKTATYADSPTPST